MKKAATTSQTVLFPNADRASEIDSTPVRTVQVNPIRTAAPPAIGRNIKASTVLKKIATMRQPCTVTAAGLGTRTSIMAARTAMTPRDTAGRNGGRSWGGAETTASAIPLCIGFLWLSLKPEARLPL